MIYTDCNDCCFCQKDQGCAIKQLCHKRNNNVINTPGYCRIFRSKSWAAATGLTNIRELYKKAMDEAKFKMDLLVLFHENVATEKHLEHTIDEVWFGSYVNKIIVADTSGSKNRKNISLKYFQNLGNQKSYKDIPILLDVALEEEPPDESSKTICRLVQKIQSPFFMAIPAGKRINNMNALSDHILRWPTRTIHWAFPIMIGGTLITVVNPNTGLYITKPYKKLVVNDGRPFTEQLNENEKTDKTGIAHSWCCDSCWMI